jgi:hypothetical protein
VGELDELGVGAAAGDRRGGAPGDDERVKEGDAMTGRREQSYGSHHDPKPEISPEQLMRAGWPVCVTCQGHGCDACEGTGRTKPDWWGTEAHQQAIDKAQAS